MPVTFSDGEQRFAQDFFDCHPDHPEWKALWDRRKAEEQERQQVFDTMALPELREAAIAALASAAEIIMNTSVSDSSDDWTTENRNNLASHFLKMAENIDDNVESSGNFNMSKWFDFFPIEDDLERLRTKRWRDTRHT